MRSPIKTQTQSTFAERHVGLEQPARSNANSRNSVPLTLIFFASGFAGLVYESIWTHYLKLFLGHAAYAQTLVLAIFMGGMALGAAVAARYTRLIDSPLRTYALIEA